MKTQRNLYNLRDIFCGYQAEHEHILQSAIQFIAGDKPGLFVIGGQNLTGKSDLSRKIQFESGFTQYLGQLAGDSNNMYAAEVIGFANANSTRLSRITRDTIRNNLSLQKILGTGIKIIFVEEAEASQKDAFTVLVDEVIKPYGAKIVMEVVCSAEGSGFFDDANRRFIETALQSAVPKDLLHLSLLHFDKEALYSGVLKVAETELDLEPALHPFNRQQRECLVQAIRGNTLETVLSAMIDYTPRSGREALFG